MYFALRPGVRIVAMGKPGTVPGLSVAAYPHRLRVYHASARTLERRTFFGSSSFHRSDVAGLHIDKPHRTESGAHGVRDIAGR